MKKYFVVLTFIFLLSFFSFISKDVFAQITHIQGNISVTAVIPPKVSDFQFSMESNSGNVPQKRTVTYEITYGASYSAGLATTNTIVAYFNDDKAPDGTHVTDYVIGSATDAYNGTQPVVDLTNRTITWTISNLPEDTLNQKVSFQVRTNDNYTALKQVTITTRATMRNEYVTMPEQSISQQYLFDPSLVTPGPTRPVTITPAVTPSPTPIASLQIIDLTMDTLSDSHAGIEVVTNKPARELIHFGTSPDALNQLVENNQFRISNILNLVNLNPATVYYFQATAIGLDGKTATSDIFTFTTAHQSTAANLTNNAVVITSGNAVILSGIANQSNTPLGIITTNTDYILTYTFSQPTSLANFEAVVRDTSGNEVRTVALHEKDSQSYTAFLSTNDGGRYEIFIRLTDLNGNIIEQKVGRLNVISPLQVLENGTGTPLADARIYLWYFNLATQKYESVTEITNPSYTNAAGIDSFILPSGRYRVEASALWHTAKTVDFTLGGNSGNGYPVISLESAPLNLFSFFHYLKNVITDTFSDLQTFLKSFAQSTRLFNIVSTVAVAGSVLLSSFFFMLRTDIRWRAIVPFMTFFLFVTAKKHKDAYLYGKVLMTDKVAVPLARVEVLNLKTNLVLAHTTTNKAGHFAIRNTFKQQYIKLVVTKEGFKEYETNIATTNHDTIAITLSPHIQAPSAFTGGLTYILGECFELLLVISLLAELVFLLSFGVMRTLPFFLLSVLNLVLWLFFNRQHKI